MSLARAFTRKPKRVDDAGSSTSASSSPSLPSSKVAHSRHRTGASINRIQISAPIALISTTNMLSYNAPDIAIMQRQVSCASATSSAFSVGSSDNDGSAASSASSTDASSVSNSPTSLRRDSLSNCSERDNQDALSPKYVRPPMELSLDATTDLTSSSSSAPSLLPLPSVGLDFGLELGLAEVSVCDGPSALPNAGLPAEDSAPAIPERAPSHSKKAHERCARKRSMQSLSSRSSFEPVRTSLNRSRSSAELSRASLKRGSEEVATAGFSHPFGKELEQLTEAVEELGGFEPPVTSLEDEIDRLDGKKEVEAEGRVAEVVSADSVYMEAHGLVRFSVGDYLSEIRPLFSSLFGESHLQPRGAWF